MIGCALVAAAAAQAGGLAPHAPLASLGDELASRVRAYAWDDGPLVPTADGLAPGAVPFGEAGLAPDTRAYLRFGTPVRDAAAGCAVELEPTAVAPAPGRYGAGLRLAAGAPPLRLRGGAASLLAPPCTLELWVRPAEPARDVRTIVEVPGVCSVCRLADGSVAVLSADAAEGAAPLLRVDRALESDAWSHVALTVDGPELDDALRLVVDGVALGRPGPAGLSVALAAANELRVGGMACDVDEVRVLGRALSTQQMIERRTPPAEPGAHRLVLTLEDGETRELEAWAGILDAPWVDDARGFARVARDHLRIEPDGLRWVEAQWRQDRPPVRPLARTTHPTVYVGAHRVLMYGGETRDTHAWPWRNTDDTWIYAANESRWRRVAVGGPAPSPRCHQLAAWSPDHGLVFYPGGWRNDRLGDALFDDVWVYRVDDERWEERHPGGPAPGVMANNGVVYHPGFRRFLVFQGRRVCVYDPEADAWERPRVPRVVDARGNPAQYVPGSSPMVGYDPVTGVVVLFGGAPSEGDDPLYQAVTAHYDVAGERVILQDVADGPSPRVRSAFAYDSRRARFVLYGGVQGQFSARMDDLWTYVPSRSEWTRIDAADGPGLRGGFYGMAFDPELDRFFVVCGRSAPERFHDDAWRLALDPQAKATAEAVFDLSTFERCSTFAARFEGAEDRQVRFAWSADGLRWTDWRAEPGEAGAARARYLRVRLEVEPPHDGEPPRLRAFGLLPDSPGRPEAPDAPEEAGLTTWALPG